MRYRGKHNNSQIEIFLHMNYSWILFALVAFDLHSQSGTARMDFDRKDTYISSDTVVANSSESAEYCTARVLDYSPTKLVSVAYDYQGPFTLMSDTLSNSAYDTVVWNPQSTRFNALSTVRVFSSIPVIVKKNIILQVGFQFSRVKYQGADASASGGMTQPVHSALSANGLRSVGLHSTLFKPINERNFFVAQVAGDLNGDYKFSNMLPLKYTRFSAAFIVGWKKSERKIFGFGISRSFRIGQLSYFPVVLFNWTAMNRKWGVEILAPSKAAVRRTINSKNLLLLGYDMEGQSYHLSRNGKYDEQSDHLELRRSELRFKLTYEFSIYKLLWMSVQAGYRYNLAFNVDSYSGTNDIFRGFTGDQPYVQQTRLTNTTYAMISLNLVSP